MYRKQHFLYTVSVIYIENIIFYSMSPAIYKEKEDFLYMSSNLKPTYVLPTLPPSGVTLETVAILKALNKANALLAELKGTAKSIPNQGILIDTLALQEAQASSAIENIVTTQDELFQAQELPDDQQSPAAKEIARYREALHLGYQHVKDMDGAVITNNALIAMFRVLKERDEGFRATHGTALKNERTGKVVYVPPQDEVQIVEHMTALERFINVDEACALDPLIKMALIHHQFESIHPFSDGNGRIGRILNVLYLVRTELLDIPILYLSRYIIQHKSEYYQLLQAVRQDQAWEAWVLYILMAVAETSAITLELVEGLREQMTAAKQFMRQKLPKIYSQDLLNNVFRHPYTRIEFVEKDLGVSRLTATKYLNKLAQAGLLHKERRGRNIYYINRPLVQMLGEAAGEL